MKKIFFIITSLILISNLSIGQKQGNIWYFGEGAGLDFNGGAPVPIIGGNILPNPQNGNEATIAEGCSSICDSAGTLLFYSNGENIWNTNHQVMPNGDSLMGMYSSTHAAFTVPKPLSDSLFYLFTTDGLERNLEDGLRYSVVDMCLDDGLGDVIPGQKNILLLDTVSEKLTAINHQNGQDVWLIAHKFNSDAFYAYLISEDGITDTVITNIGSVHTGNGFYSAIGQMKSSPNGNKIALVFSNINPAVAEIFDFNKTTGVLSNHISLSTDNNEYGVEFSPDNSKLYITNIAGLHQFDLLAGGGTQTAINASKTNIPMPYICIPAGIQLGPDNKIYVNRCSTFVAVINDPNEAGTSCDFVDEAINFGSTFAKVSFPSFITSFEYRNAVSKCETPVIIDDTSEINDLSNFKNYKLYPNPANQKVIIECVNSKQKNHSLTIYDSQGNIVKATTFIDSNKNTIDVSSLKSGFYFFQIFYNQQTYFIEKVIIE